MSEDEYVLEINKQISILRNELKSLKINDSDNDVAYKAIERKVAIEEQIDTLTDMLENI